MLKIHQLFLIFFFVTTTTLFGSLSFYLYQHEKSNAFKRADKNLDTIIELAYISMKADGMSDGRISDLAKKTNSHIGILDNKLGKFAISDKSIISMDIFLGLQDFSHNMQKDVIDGNLVVYKAIQKDLDGKIYTIITAINIDNIYLTLTPMFIRLLAIFLAGLVFTYMIAKIFSKLMDKELSKIQYFLENVARKNYNITIKRSLINEFDMICLQLNDMKNSMESLDDKLNKRSAKIRLKNTQLEGILSSISHEFKNPISIITASAQTLKNDPNMDEASKDKFITKIVKNSEKLVNLIDKLKIAFIYNFSLKTEDVNLKALSLEISKELMDKFKGRNILVKGDNVIIKADADMIRQVIQNLCENALKYSDDSVEIIITNSDLVVKDSGVGVSQKDIKLITKKFYRADENSWNNSFGLGLYIVKNILKLHGFEMIIDSQLGIGSTFGFRFRSDV